MHLLGQQISTRIFRNNRDIYLNQNKLFSYEFQNSYDLMPAVNLTADDILITECVYSTSSKSIFTFGGYGMDNEVCQHYFLYYPRRERFKYCESFTDIYEQYKFLYGLER